MLKKALATAVAATMLFACSSDDDDDNNKKTPPASSTSISSSSQNNTTGGSSSSQSSSSGNNTTSGSSSSQSASSGGSSSSQMAFTLLYDFEEESDNFVGYVWGKGTLGNDCIPAADEESEDECELDDEGEPYLNWIPGGIFTLKDFSFNDGTSNDAGGGLIIKNFAVNDYAAIRFDVRSTASGNHMFRIKAKKDDQEAAFKIFFNLSASPTFNSTIIEIKEGNFQKDYGSFTGLNALATLTYVIEHATEIEFLIPQGLFATSTTKHTLEIDNFSVALK